LDLFLRASKKGDLTGALMTGLMHFHGFGIERDVQQGAYFLAKCVTDPIALLHVGVVCGDDAWLARAAIMLNVPKDSYQMFEWLGDLFADGVKLPLDVRIAAMWYGVALKQSELHGEENMTIIEKIARIM
jgi:TPR repeat protein